MPEELRCLAELLERRWQLSVLFAALAGAIRWREFATAVEGISPRMLTERLRELADAGMIERSVIPCSPPAVEYRLTARGRALAPLIEALHTCAGDAVLASWSGARGAR